MRIHRNAQTTPASRSLLVRRITQQGWTGRAASAAVGMSLRSLGQGLSELLLLSSGISCVAGIPVYNPVVVRCVVVLVRRDDRC